MERGRESLGPSLERRLRIHTRTQAAALGEMWLVDIPYSWVYASAARRCTLAHPKVG